MRVYVRRLHKGCGLPEFTNFPVKYVEEGDFVAYCNCGFALGGFAGSKTQLYLRDIYIEPTARRGGLGGVLVNKLIKFSGAKTVLIFPTVAGEKFFKSLGFRRTKAGTMYKSYR